MATLADLEENSFVEVLSFLGYDLGALEPLRLIAKCFLKPCDARKAYIHRLFAQGAKVQIVNLASAKGREMNGRVAKIDGPATNGRYPLRLRHISGDVEAVSLKARNLNPFFALSEEEELAKAKRQAFVSYSHPIGGYGGTEACVLEGHGRLLRNCMTALRYHLMHMDPSRFFVNCTIQEFADVEGGPQTEHLNDGIYESYRLSAAELEQAGDMRCGITDFPQDMSLHSMLVWQLLMNERGYIEYEGAMVSRSSLDGEGGSKIVHNFCRFANVWDTERIAGNNLGDDALGNVYLVKGMGSRVGDTLRVLPQLCKLRAVPIYNVLVYDGFFRENTDVTPSAEFVSVLKAKVDSALRKQEVIFCGKSAYEGLWDDEPPKPEMPEYSGPTNATYGRG